MSSHRRRVVGVLGSGSGAGAAAAEVGRLVASLGYDLLTGGGGGVMAAASRAFAETPGRKGLCIGIIPGSVDRMTDLETRATGTGRIRLDVNPRYPNQWVELAIFTHLPDSGEAGTLRSSRNHINVLSSNVLVALPGGAGTESEMWLALRYGIPLIAYGAHGSLPEGVGHARDAAALEAFLRDHLPTSDA